MKYHHRVHSDTLLPVTPIQQLISSCSGAILTSLLTTPFDVVKVRLQRQQSTPKPCYILDCRAALDGVCICTYESPYPHLPPYSPVHRYTHYTGTLDAFVKLARTEGVGSWWKGLSPTLLMAVPLTVIYYTLYDQLKVRLGFNPNERNFAAPLVSGVVARTVAVTAVCPIELVRTKLQSRTGLNISEVLSVVRTVTAQNGVLSLWRGLSPMLLRDVPFSVIYWLGYEDLKRNFTNRSLFYQPLVPFVAGSIAGTFAAIVTTPLDVVKTHMQVELGEPEGGNKLGVGSMSRVMRTILQEYGTPGLFAGLIPRVAKVAPACAIMIGTYETFKDFFSEYNASH